MFRTMWLAGIVCLIAVSSCLFGQQRVDPRNMYERVLAIVPMVGSGTLSDPKRPMYAPAPSALNASTRTGVLAFAYAVSDDGTMALVELVAADRSAFRDILADSSVKTFLRSRDKLDTIVAAFKLLKKDFDINQFGVRLP